MIRDKLHHQERKKFTRLSRNQAIKQDETIRFLLSGTSCFNLSIMAVEIRISSRSIVDPKQHIKAALDDIESNFNFATNQHPIRTQRFFMIAHMIEDLLATMLAGCKYRITSERLPDGSDRYNQDVVGQFESRTNPLSRHLGGGNVQTALQNIQAAIEVFVGRVDRQDIEEFRQSFAAALPALRAAVAACQSMPNYGKKRDVDYNKAGPAFEGTMLT